MRTGLVGPVKSSVSWQLTPMQCIQFRWVKPMIEAGWEDLLAATHAGTLVSQTWKRAPVL
jgi:hypothetical protein